MSEPSNSPIVVGLIGGVASGKSSVAKELERLGAIVLDADATGHEALRAPEVIAALCEAFGDGIKDESGAIDRKALAAQAFISEAQVKRLNAITHPWIRARMSERLSAARKQPRLAAVVLDVSLLLESGAYEGEWQELLFVDAPRDQRAKRAIETRGWQPGELERRESLQWPLEKKQSLATWVIENAGSPEQLNEQVQRFWSARIATNSARVSGD